jgi:undecaprenyl-diphosphatase
MLEKLEHLDRQLFLLINSANSPFWDKVMNFMSLIGVWIPLYLAILVYLGFIYRKKFIIVVLFIAAAITLSDQISVLIKNSVDRLRPCHDPELQGLVHLVNNTCGGLYSFVSSHAANSFNVAMLSLLLVRNKWYSVFIIVWAAVVSYSRVYLGVHYPGDILCGSLLGLLLGWIIYVLFEMTDRKVLQRTAFFNPASRSGTA